MGREVDVAAVVGDKNVFVSATGFHGRSEAAESSRETVRMKGEQSKEVGSRESQREGVASAREGWKGGVLEERRVFLTTSR